jgi:histidinol dehydrogenase
MIPVYTAKDENAWKQRLQRKTEADASVAMAVHKIIDDVRARGDTALYEYTAKFDGADLRAKGLAVSPGEYEEAYKAVNQQTLDALKRAAESITAFHEKQKRESWEMSVDGCRLGQIIRPIATAGVYVPGGKASYPSSVLMNVLPAKVAGVKTIVMVTPPDREGKVSPLRLVAAKESGADIVYKIGGAQAIAALAYGTESIFKVDKITGPGNAYVAQAKREVFGQVGIDMLAGPSEILVIADENANPAYVAADMLSQAEHDEMAAAILVTTSRSLALKVIEEIGRAHV